jgi:two-component system cell cycle sensor histidine kinase/response regulator CckA
MTKHALDRRRVARALGVASVLAGVLVLSAQPAFAQGVAEFVGGTGAVLSIVLALALAGALVYTIDRGRKAEAEAFHRAIDVLERPYALVAADGTTSHANASLLALFGKLGAERPFEALEIWLASDPEGKEKLAQLVGHHKTGTGGQLEVELAQEGKRESLLVSILPLPGVARRSLLGVEDITSRRAMEQTIREEEKRLYEFLENAPVGFYSADAEGRFRFVNHTLAAWLDTTVDMLLAGERRLGDFLIGAPAGTGEPYDAFGGQDETRGEVAFRGLQGRSFKAFLSQSIVKGERPGELRARAVVRDLTPEVEWAETLKLSEQRFNRFFEDAPVGIAMLDADARIMEGNRAFHAMVGDKAGATGRPFLELVVSSDRADADERLRAALAGKEGNLAPFDVRYEGEGREGVASLFVNRFDYAEGRPAGLIIHALDTTEQKRLEVQFAQSQKMQAVGQLAGGIAHDFNNLLTAMIGFCDLLLLRHRPGEQSFADVMQIKQNANRAANLVRQLLAFSRRQTLQPKVLNVTDVLAELTHLLQRLIGENIALTMAHGRDLGLVRVDQGQLEQVIINLVVNARDAMAGGGQLTIRTGNVSRAEVARAGHELMTAGEYVLIEVRDTGIGIPKEIIGRIFEPFFSTKEVGQGTGLGLSTVYGIVKQTGGFIFVDSAPGRGAGFKVYLPRHTGEAAEASAAALPSVREVGDLSGVGTVLLVEDEDAVRLFSARALRNKGYEVFEASSGEGALELLKSAERPIDLLITDVVMPRMDGPTLIREVREARPSIKVICISGYAEDGFRKTLDQSSDIFFLPKPFSLNQLAGKVKEVMGHEVRIA